MKVLDKNIHCSSHYFAELSVLHTLVPNFHKAQVLSALMKLFKTQLLLGYAIIMHETRGSTLTQEKTCIGYLHVHQLIKGSLLGLASMSD